MLAKRAGLAVLPSIPRWHRVGTGRVSLTSVALLTCLSLELPGPSLGHESRFQAESWPLLGPLWFWHLPTRNWAERISSFPWSPGG